MKQISVAPELTPEINREFKEKLKQIVQAENFCSIKKNTMMFGLCLLLLCAPSINQR